MQKMSLYRSRRLRILFILLAVLWATVIFLLSNEAADESSKRSNPIAEVLVSALHQDFEALPEPQQVELLSSADHIVRKCTHFAAYALLGGLVCLSSLGFSSGLPTHFCRSLLLSALYAASDEFHQSFVPGRGPSVSDVLLDSTGALCGILFILLIAVLVLKKKKS